MCEEVQTPSVRSVEYSEERKEVSCGPGEQLEDEDVQCSDGGSGCDGDDVDEESVDENEIGEEVSEEVCEAAGDQCDEEIGEELREDAVEDGSEEQLEDAEEVQCQEVDLDYVDEEGEIVEEEEVEKEERQVEVLGDEHNPRRSQSSEVSCPDSDSEETSPYSSTRNSSYAVSYTHLDVYKRQVVTLPARQVHSRGIRV